MPREVLVVSVGLAPQVVTEVLWWMVAGRTERLVPHAIHVVTTSGGGERVREKLLGRQGKLAEFCREFGLPDLCARLVLHLSAKSDSHADGDARDIDASVDFANGITRLLRDLTADPKTRVHACFAGGRKIMSFYMGYAMSLLGRSGDDLCHVLVTPAFENSEEFWWKPKVPRMVSIGPGGEALSTDNAEITVISVPFVRLRYLMDSTSFSEGSTPLDFAKFVGDAQATVERLRIVLTDSRLELTVGAQTARLPPKKYALYRLLAERQHSALDGDGWLTLADVDEAGKPPVQRFLDIYENLPQSRVATKGISLRENYESMPIDGLQTEFNRELSNLNRILDGAFDDYILRDRVRIRRERGQPKRGVPARFGLALEAGAIEIVAD